MLERKGPDVEGKKGKESRGMKGMSSLLERVREGTLKKRTKENSSQPGPHLFPPQDRKREKALPG